MKLKNSWKRFWTLDRHHAAGFTLVELIVVIAILAILAGVAIPVYSGYIKKAELAADEQLLGAINTAFAAACLANGYNHVDAEGSMTVNADGTIGQTVTRAASRTYFNEVRIGNKDVLAKVNESFAVYYAGNESSVFKSEKYVGKTLNLKDGMFTVGSGAYDNLTFDEALIALVQNSAFLKAEGLGVNTLMDKVDYITGLAASLADQETNNGAWQMLSRYNQDLIDDLGIVFPDNFAELSEEEQAAVMAPLYTMVNDKVAALDKQNIAGWSEMTDEEKSLYAQNQILANYAVLDAAKQMKGQNASDVLNTIKSTSNFTDLIKNTDTGVSNAAAAYGLYTAYAYSIEDPAAREAAIAKANDPVNLLKAMDDPAFRAYLDKPEAETDLAGYMAAMEMVDASASDEDAVYNLMINGFTDPELLAVIQQALNK